MLSQLVLLVWLLTQTVLSPQLTLHLSSLPVPITWPLKVLLTPLLPQSSLTDQPQLLLPQSCCLRRCCPSPRLRTSPSCCCPSRRCPSHRCPSPSPCPSPSCCPSCPIHCWSYPSWSWIPNRCPRNLPKRCCSPS